MLYSGTLGKVNDIPYLGELASELGRLQYGIPILVVGDGAEKTKVIDLSQRLGILDEQIFFLPAVSKLQIPDVFRLAAAVISTS
jgi:glycosyltransferase involved in cell wall biosynthesis